MLERECKKPMQRLCKESGWAGTAGVIMVLFGACSRPIRAPSPARSAPQSPSDAVVKVESRASSDAGLTDPRLAAWQGTWVVPDSFTLKWSILEIHGDSGRLTSSWFSPGPHPVRIAAVHPCRLDLESGSPKSGPVDRFFIPFVFDGETLHAGTNVAIRSDGRVVACTDYIYAFDGSACRIETGLPGTPAPDNVTCGLDGDIFFVGGDLLVPMHGNVGWADPVVAVRVASFAEAQKVLAEKEAATYDFTGSGVPIGFAGVRLGDRFIGPWRNADVGKIAGADAGLTVSLDSRGFVDEVDVVIAAGRSTIEAALTPRFGKPVAHRWVGPSSQMIVIESDSDYSGSTSVTLVILPPGETHVCGARDGFAQFYRRFERAVGAKNWAAVGAMMVFPRHDWSDVEGPETNVDNKSATDFIASPYEVFQGSLPRLIAAGGTKPRCDLVARMSSVLYGNERHSPAVYVLRQSSGEWRIVNVDHAPHDLF